MSTRNQDLINYGVGLISFGVLHNSQLRSKIMNSAKNAGENGFLSVTGVGGMPATPHATSNAASVTNTLKATTSPDDFDKVVYEIDADTSPQMRTEGDEQKLGQFEVVLVVTVRCRLLHNATETDWQSVDI